MDTRFKRKGTTSSCVAINCSMRGGTNLLSNVRMFRFPSDPFRKRMWECAVRRKDWSSTKSSHLCNRHFVTGAPSQDSAHVDYVPTLFQFNDNASFSMAKHKRRLRNKRKKKVDGKASRNPDHPDFVPSVFDFDIEFNKKSKESYLNYLKNLGVFDYKDNSCSNNEPYKSPLILKVSGTTSSETDSADEVADLCRPLKEKNVATMTELSMQDIKHFEEKIAAYKTQVELYKKLILSAQNF